MSTPLIERMNVKSPEAEDDFIQWEAELANSSNKKLGAAACAGCPLMINNLCPGKSSAVQECPPEARVIQKPEIRAALGDDTVGSIIADGGGSYYTLPNRVATTQAAIDLQRQRAKEKKMAPAASTSKAPKSSERAPVKKGPGLLHALGEFVVSLIGGKSRPSSKK